MGMSSLRSHRSQKEEDDVEGEEDTAACRRVFNDMEATMEDLEEKYPGTRNAVRMGLSPGPKGQLPAAPAPVNQKAQPDQPQLEQLPQLKQLKQLQLKQLQLKQLQLKQLQLEQLEGRTPMLPWLGKITEK